MAPRIQIRTSSEKFGPVDFVLVGNIVTKMDTTGDMFAPTRTHDASMKWIFEEINRMRELSPDLTFVQ